MSRRERLALALSGDLRAVLEHVELASQALERAADITPAISGVGAELETALSELRGARALLRGSDE